MCVPNTVLHQNRFQESDRNTCPDATFESYEPSCIEFGGEKRADFFFLT